MLIRRKGYFAVQIAPKYFVTAVFGNQIAKPPDNSLLTFYRYLFLSGSGFPV